MKLVNESKVNGGAGSAFRKVCVASCQKVLAQIKNAKAEIFREARVSLQAREHLLELALNEAEALAMQTLYPHLVFPTLATEKVQTVVAWERHQKLVRRADQVFRLAA
jgi:hypothetical protein